MKENELDSLDKRLLHVLIKEGRLAAGNIAEKLEITPPTVRNRIEALISSGIMKVAGILNPSKLKDVILALVCISLDKHQELDMKIEQVAELPQVHWVAAVTGKYDIIVEIILTNGMPDLYRFITEQLPKMGGIRSSESFLVMKAKRKWILLPENSEIFL